jgi:hypothetical protein
MELHHVTEIDLTDVAECAERSGRYQRQPVSMVKQCKRELSRACRDEYYTDPQGRDVRKMHPVRIRTRPTQLVFWVDITTAQPKHMRRSFSQRRRMILADCRQHKTDVDSYNDKNIYNEGLPLFDYNFSVDLKEESLPTYYDEDNNKER